MTIDFLDGIRAERDERRRRYLIVFGEALELHNLRTEEREEFERIDAAFLKLHEESTKKEAALEPLREADRDEYVVQMSDLLDSEAKEFSRLTGELRTLVREVKLRRGGSPFRH